MSKTLLDINIDDINVEIVNKSSEKTISSKNKNDAILQSKGLTESNINFSKQLMKFINLKLDNNLHYDNLNRVNSKIETIHYVVTYYNPKVKVSIQPKDIKLSQDIIDKFKKALANEDDKEKLKKISEIFNLYGMFIPTGFLLGGKYNILIDAKNSDDINEKLSNLKNDLNFFANEQKIGGKFEKDKINQSNNKIEDLNKNVDIEGGDTNLKNVEEWKKSLTLNNLEIIEYLSLQNLYKFCGEDISKEIEELEVRLKNEEIKIEQENNIKAINLLNDNIVDMDLTIGIFGAKKTGKTSIMNRIKNKEFSQNIIDYCYLQKYLDINNEKKLIRAKFYDNRENYIRKCDGIILVYDISETASFKKITELKKIIDQNIKVKIPFFLIGNKKDLVNNKKVKEDYVKNLCQKLEIDFKGESSCKELNDNNLEKLIGEIIDKCAKEAFNNNDNNKCINLEEENYENKKETKQKKSC